MEKLYTCEEVSKRYSVKLGTVWAWIRRRELPAIKIGRVYRIRESDLLKFEEGK